MKIAIVTDSSSTIYDLDYDLDGIYKLPLQVSSGNHVYLEGESIDRNQAFDMLEAGQVFTTSLPPLGRIESLYEELKDQGYNAVFAMPISSGLSSTLSAMESAAKTVGLDFYYFDLFTGGEILLTYAKAARIMFDKGFSVEKVLERLKAALDHSITYIIPDDLRHLMRSGRLSKASTILGGLLKIKPVLYLNEETGGKIEPIAKPRTMVRAIKTALDGYIEAGIDNDCIVYINHIRNIDMANRLKAMVLEKLPNIEVHVKELVLSVAIHVGIGGIATQYTRRVNVD